MTFVIERIYFYNFQTLTEFILQILRAYAGRMISYIIYLLLHVLLSIIYIFKIEHTYIYIVQSIIQHVN